MKGYLFYAFIILFCFTTACKKEDSTPANPEILQILSARVGTVDLNFGQVTTNTPIDKPIVIAFSKILNTETVQQSISLKDENNNPIIFAISYLDENKTISLQTDVNFLNNKKYSITIANTLKGKEGETFAGISYEFQTKVGELILESITIDGKNLKTNNKIAGIDTDFEIQATFSHSLKPETVNGDNVRLLKGSQLIPLNYTLSNDNKTLTIKPVAPVDFISKFFIQLNTNLSTPNNFSFNSFQKDFATQIDPTPKFPTISDEALLTLVQQQTFKYFWDFAHPNSGLARERNNSGDLVTSGGSGFGIMSIIVGIERGFITRQQGVDRLEKIVNFLTTADSFHGAWSHWLNGNTGDVIPFSSLDNGGDLVETSFLMQGLLTFRQYLNPANSQENTLITKINTLWEGVEWDWYRRDNQQVLYWHWSPNFGWQMNFPLRGYNEGLITYVLAASSPTHSIPLSVYQQGWARNGNITNGKTFYGFQLPLGEDLGGPLFFTHYSFLGLRPNGLSDAYANYLTQTVNHSKINHAYCVANPKNFYGYSTDCWGLTASDNNGGYSAHSPTNDLGVISPTAAVSSLPYTPTESMRAIRYFYYTLGDKLWGEYGFKDAFNLNEAWFASSYLAIDQGPMIVMIENHRTGLLWDLLMSCPEVQSGLTKLGFTFTP